MLYKHWIYFTALTCFVPSTLPDYFAKAPEFWTLYFRF